MIGRTLSNHRILSKLGAGGMGEVYLAEDTELERKVALKVLPENLAGDPERLARFRREAKAVAALEHPNIVTIHSIEEADGVRFLTMEHVEGRDLGAEIPRHGMPLERFFDLAIPLADALAAAHGKGIAHRDLKPANVMVTPDDRVKILDFGLAKRVGGALGDDDETFAASEVQTSKGQILGTVAYMSPEQAQGEEVDARSDIFSLGIVLYEMVTGRRPFAGKNNLTLLSAILRDRPAAPTSVRSDLPAELDRILRRCLEKKAVDRFQTARDVCNELKYLREQLDSGVRQSGKASLAGPRPRVRGRRMWIAAAAAIVVVAAGLGWRLWPRPDPVTSPDLVEVLVALPAEIVSGDEGDAYLTDAVPNALTTHLTGIPGVETKVPPKSTQVDALRGTILKSKRRRLADLSGASAFVETSMTALGDGGFALDVRLVQARGQSVLWSDHSSGPRDDYLDLVRQAGKKLRETLRPGAAAGRETATTGSSSAELALERGRYARNQYNINFQPEDFETARAAFEEALELDENLAEAAGEMAHLHALRYLSQFDPAHLEKANEWSRRALRMDPRLANAWAVRFYLELAKTMGLPGVEGDFDPVVTLEYALKGAGLGPRDCLVQEGMGLAMMAGYSTTLAIASFEESARLNPFYTSALTNTAGSRLAMGDTEGSAARLRKALQVAPEDVGAIGLQLLTTALEGNAAAVRRGLRLVEAAGEQSEAADPLIAWYRSILEMGLAFANGDGATLRTLAEEYLRDEKLSAYPTPIGWMLARWGEREMALRFLEREGSKLRYPYDLLLLSPDWDGLRDDPRFAAAAGSARARFETMLAALDDARLRDEMPAYLEQPLALLLERLEWPLG